MNSGGQSTEFYYNFYHKFSGLDYDQEKITCYYLHEHVSSICSQSSGKIVAKQGISDQVIDVTSSTEEFWYIGSGLLVILLTL